LRGWLWPDIGWRRLGIYLVKRVTRLPGTPHSIAAGLACGTAISFTPFIGLHTLLSVLLSFLVRGNYLAAIIGTLVGNPWTFPVIWLVTYQAGHYMLGSTPSRAAPEPELTSRWYEIRALIWPMTVGGVPLGALAGVAVYCPLVRLIAASQEARRRRRERRRAERLDKLPEPSASPGAGLP
jgi:uncharacterized protein (DUF2062 family)